MAETPSTSSKRTPSRLIRSPLPLPPLAGGGEEEADEDGEDLEELEREVKELGQQVRHYRATMPGAVLEAVESLLVSRRPVIPEISEGSSKDRDGSDLGKVSAQQNKKMQFGEQDPEVVEKIELLKTKVAHNVISIPIVLKRVDECLSALQKLERYDLNVNPCFKRRRT